MQRYSSLSCEIPIIFMSSASSTYYNGFESRVSREYFLRVVKCVMYNKLL